VSIDLDADDRDIALQHRRALDATREIVARIHDDRWGAPTPCAGWDVRALLSHVVAGNWWASRLAAGATIEEVGDAYEGDVLGPSPLGAYHESAEAAARVFEAPGALDAPCAVSYGPVPGEVYAGHRFVDVLVHGWDLAVATGQDTTLDPALVDAAWTVIEPQLDMLRASGQFGTERAVPDGAPAQDRLLLVVGRTPA
jgi:uncharacterized protein (TIGR03086 family)